jgi:HD-like signal output (HDOD) protein
MSHDEPESAPPSPVTRERRRVLLIDQPAATNGRTAREWSQRMPWDVVCVPSAEAALEQLAGARFDALVSDLDSPGIDGAELLARVRERYPDVCRLCLTDRLDEAAFVRAVPVTHQFLSKPCRPETLYEVVERICSLRSILENEAARGFVSKLKSLPATPQTFTVLAEAIDRPNAHTAAITDIVTQDTSLSVKLLQIVNSAFFRRGAAITSLPAAVNYVGLEMIRSLALCACVFNALDAVPRANSLLRDLQARSLRKARFVHELLRDSRHADTAFTAALLADVGQAVLAIGSFEQFERMQSVARERAAPWHLVEPEFFGVAHPEVGAYLLGLWGLPLELIEAVAYHHTPSRIEHQELEILTAVHVADAMVYAGADQPLLRREELDAAFIARPRVARYLRAWNIDTESAAAATPAAPAQAVALPAA